MREILFRGKNADNGEWVYGYYAHFKDMHDVKADIIYTGYADAHMGSILPDCYDVNPKTVGQYTGLTDKNGTKIFEHDIVRIAVCGTYDNYVISYDKENARFVVGDTGFTFWSYISTKIEVIGNIHDNPELLKG